jgi:hypothetical protein
MYKSFDILSVRDEADLRDPARLARLSRARNLGMKVAAVVIGLVGAACLALGAGGIYVKFSVASAPPEAGWVMMGVGFFFGLLAVIMSRAFFKEIGYSALALCARDPRRCAFAKGRIDSADYLSSGGRSSRRMLVHGSFGQDGLFIEEFDPDLWSDAVAERGEEHGLRAGDDRYDQKGRRVKLPIEVWVVYNTERPRMADLAGIPAETVERLKKAAGKR